MQCVICNLDIPAERMRKHSKFCSEECRKSYRLLYMRFKKHSNALWEMVLSSHRKAQGEASNSVTEAV
jgi:hypothetical protein